MNHPLLTRLGILACMVLMALPAMAQRQIDAVRVNTSEPLRDIVARQAAPNVGIPMAIPNKFPRSVQENGVSRTDAATTQDMMGLMAPATIGVNFDGSQDADNVDLLGFAIVPPDTEGDVGPNQYVQWINLVGEIFNKDGTTLLGPFAGNDFFDGLGGDCETMNSGDPIVLYDEVNDRWMVSQFSINRFVANFMCIAVSTTPDPTGSYHQYAFPFGTEFPDYPKLGIQESGLYMSLRIFDAGPFRVDGCVADYASMLVGGAATLLCDTIGNDDGTVPADNDAVGGSIDDGLYFGHDPGNSIDVYEQNPATGVITPLITIPVSAYTVFGGNVPTPGESLNSIGFATMHRAQMREDQGHQTVVLNHTVSVGGLAAPRWYELRNSGGGWALFQEGTYAPADGVHRWMGSIAMNADGDIALGYSAANSNLNPAIRVTGQTAANSGSGIMDVTETSIIEGTGSQTSSANRWGDYSMMSVDPSDGTTFWHTNEYYANTGSFDFNTRIASFKLESDGGGGDCDSPDAQLVDDAGFTWCWTDADILNSGVTGPDDLVCSGQGVDMSGFVLDAYPAGTSTTAAVCRDERAFEGEAVNAEPDGCDQFSDSFIYDGTRKGMLSYSGPWNSFCNGDPLASGEWSGTFDQNIRAPQVQRRAALPMLGKRALRRAERGLSRANRVRKGDIEGPVEFALEQNYPNPFNPSTQVRFALAEASNVSLRVYNLLGQEVAVLASGRMEAGRHEVQFDASQLTAGVYLYVLEAGDFTATKRLTLLK